MGIEIVKNKDKIQAALKELFKYDQKLLVEEYIPGREFKVGMANGQMLPIVETIPPQENDFLDFHAKFTSNMTINDCPPTGLSDEELKTLSDLAAKAFKVFKSEGMGSVDFIRAKEDEFYILEMNSTMGLTDRSPTTIAGKVAGMSFSELCYKIMSGAV